MSPAYYAVQRFEGTNDSMIDRQWRSYRDTQSANVEAVRKRYNSTCLDSPWLSIRLVKAFISEYTGNERVLEVLALRESKE